MSIITATSYPCDWAVIKLLSMRLNEERCSSCPWLYACVQQ